jgi:hypothetical protein
MRKPTILLAGFYKYSWHEEAWERSLKELGYKVYSFKFIHYFSGLTGRLQYRFVSGPALWRANRELLAFCKKCQPDILVAYRALSLHPFTLQKIRRISSHTMLVSYQNDSIFGALRNKAYWRLFRSAIPLYDLHLVYRCQDLERYIQYGAKDVYMLRSHYLPWLHKKFGHSSWFADIGYYGHYEDDMRSEWMTQLMKQCPANYGLRGSNWDKKRMGRPWEKLNTREVQGQEYVEAINGTSIALCFLSTMNEDSYTRRCFEIPACGSFMLSQRTSELQALYEEDREAVFFSDTKELVDKANYYLRNDNARTAIAEAGHTRCLNSGYDIQSRMKEWLSQIEK